MRDVAELTMLAPEEGESELDFRKRTKMTPPEWQLWRNTDAGRNAKFVSRTTLERETDA